MPRLGAWELAIILAIVLLIFGVGRVPEVGSALGRGIRAFKSGVTGKEDVAGGKEKSNACEGE